MIETHLGETIDIHGGGHDLVFPHHENEIAQGCGAHGMEYARYWVHNGHVTVDGEKMSKSLGNFRLLRDLLEVYPGEVLRLALLARHYRAPLNFSERSLEQARNSLNSLYRVLRDHADTPPAPMDVRDTAAFAALLDDLNTPAAIAELHRLGDALAGAASAAEAARCKAELLAAGDLLGLLQQEPVDWFQGGTADAPSTEWIEERIAERQAARRARDFARSDAIRDELAAAGVQLEDTASGTRWQRAEAMPTDET